MQKFFIDIFSIYLNVFIRRDYSIVYLKENVLKNLTKLNTYQLKLKAQK